MVYSTCTFAVEENEEVIKYLLENTNASIEKINIKVDFNESIGDVGGVRLYPFNFKGEGHFICLIKCNDDHECKVMKRNKLAGRRDVELYKEFENTFGIDNLTLVSNYCYDKEVRRKKKC